MEDFPVLLLFLVFYLIAASLSGKKKKNAPMHVSRKDGEREAGMILQELLAKKQSEGMCAQGGVPKPDAHGLCNEEKMHLHEVSQRQFDEAAEGEDPCHAGGQTPEEETRFDAFATEDGDAFAQDVLRGVIMSEILTRPCERQLIQKKGFR